MASAIGVRIYVFTVHRKGSIIPVRFDSRDIPVSPCEFIDQFVKRYTVVTQNNDAERSWFFETKEVDGPGCSRGYVNYGTFGFESNFIDNKTKEKKYRREVTDIEEIPLYYEYWCPERQSFGFVAFQSFQGRSCISLVMTKMKEVFEARNSGYTILFKKILPNDMAGSAYFSSPVKRLRLIRRKTSGDIADRYFDNPHPDAVDFEMIISARRNRSLGNLESLFRSLPNGDRSVITHDGIDFPEAVAEIKVGRRTRRVGVLGINGDAGVIDLTDAVVRGADGHPTFESVSREVDKLLEDFYEIVSKRSQ